MNEIKIDEQKLEAMKKRILNLENENLRTGVLKKDEIVNKILQIINDCISDRY